MDDPIVELEAEALELGGIWAALERSYQGVDVLEPMVLRVEEHEDGMLRVELLDDDQKTRFAFLVRGERLIDAAKSPRSFEAD